MTPAPRWRQKQLTSSVTHVPALPGLYVIGNVESYLGLEQSRTFAYVGRTMNLRRRLAEHSHLTELNPGLASYLRARRSGVRIWYTTDLPRRDLERYERALIRALTPAYNRLRYKGNQQHE